MKKLLLLVKYTALTGDIEFSEHRLIMVEVKSFEEDGLEEAYLKFPIWFSENYPESTLKSCIVYKTI